MKLRPTFLLAAVLLVAPGWARIHPSLPEPGTLDGVGVNIHFTDPQPGELEMMRAAGIRWVRMDFSWAGTEPAVGKYDFSRYDHLVAALEPQGIRPYFILDYGNPRYAEPGEAHPFMSRAGTPEFRAAYARWAVAAVTHFQGKGIVWEIWNEPNIPAFWKPSPKVGDYLALVKATAAALQAAGLRADPKSPKYFDAPGECLVGPAASEVDLSFLEACFAGGLLDVVDAVSVHPYRQTAPETAVEEYRAVRLLIRRYCAEDTMPLGSYDPARPTPRRHIPILAGEWGYSTAWKDFSDERQATYVPRMFLTNIANEIPLTIYYDWRDDGDDPKEGEHRFGLVRRPPTGEAKQPFAPKPAYVALKVMGEELKGMRVAQAVEKGTKAILFAKPDRETLVCWSPTPVAAAIQDLPVMAREWRVTGADGVAMAPAKSDRGELPPPPQMIVRYWQPAQRDPSLQLRAGWDRLPLEVMLNAPDVMPIELVLKNGTALTWALTADLATTGGHGVDTIDTPDFNPNNTLRPGENDRRNMIAAWDFAALATGYSLVAGYTATPGDGPSLSFRQSCPIIPLNAMAYRILPSPGRDLLVSFSTNFERPMEAVWYDPSESRADGTKVTRTFALPAHRAETVEKLPYNRAKLPDSHQKVRVVLVFVEPRFRVPFDAPCPVMMADVAAKSFSLHPDGDAKVASEQTLADAQPAEGLSASGTASLRLNYHFSAGWKFLRMESKEPALQKIEGEPSRYGLWIYGDGQGGIPCIRFRDALGQVFQVRGEPIGWKGWRYVTWPLKQEESATPAGAIAVEQRTSWGNWGGAEKDGKKPDGTIHYPIEWDTLFLLDGGKREMAGEIFLSAPSLVY